MKATTYNHVRKPVTAGCVKSKQYKTQHCPWPMCRGYVFQSTPLHPALTNHAHTHNNSNNKAISRVEIHTCDAVTSMLPHADSCAPGRAAMRGQLHAIVPDRRIGSFASPVAIASPRSDTIVTRRYTTDDVGSTNGTCSFHMGDRARRSDLDVHVWP